MNTKSYENQKIYIGCCGAYCGTCKPFNTGACKGCKIGYDNGQRDINKAKCRMKVCCFKEKGLDTCADCPDFSSCEILSDFYGKKGHKYKKYKQSIEFIIKNGYGEFQKQADEWKNAYGKLIQ